MDMQESQWNRKTTLLVAADVACLALAAAISYYAVTEWPARYRLHTLSWTITTYFVVFVALSVLGPILATWAWRVRNYPTMYRAAGAPVVWLALGFGIGALKLFATHDL
jgi:hypothetical protein